MADLPTNFKDDILDTSVNTRRRYRVYENTDGTIELEDVTEYSQVGDEFGAGQINATNREVNKRFDKNMIVRNLNTINAITKEGYVPDALALKEVNDSLQALIKKIYPYGISLIPDMTSDTSPSGIASASAVYDNSSPAYYAFDGKESTAWKSNSNATNTKYIQYQFETAQCVKKIHLIAEAAQACTYTFSGSNDGTTFTDLSTFTVSSGSQVSDYFDISNTESYKYYRLSAVKNSSGFNGVTIYSLMMFDE